MPVAVLSGGGWMITAAVDVGDRVVGRVEACEVVITVGGLGWVGVATMFKDVGVSGRRQAAFVVGEAGAEARIDDTAYAVAVPDTRVARLEHTGTAGPK